MSADQLSKEAGVRLVKFNGKTTLETPISASLRFRKGKKTGAHMVKGVTFNKNLINPNNSLHINK